MDLTGMEVANASLLDEGTAAAEAMAMLFAARPRPQVKAGKNRFLVDAAVYPQTLSVLRTRAAHLDIDMAVMTREEMRGAVEADDAGVMAVPPLVWHWTRTLSGLSSVFTSAGPTGSHR